jgi:hypothetical protein
MKTIVHIETTDEDRNKLYSVWNENSPSKKMVSRSDVTARVLTHIEEEIAQYDIQRLEPDPATIEAPAEPLSIKSAGIRNISVPQELLELKRTDDFTMPTAAELADACNRVLEHIALNKETDTINVGWCISIIAATGAV